MSKQPYKPTRLKALEGGRISKQAREAEPKPRPIAPEMPKDIDPGAKKAFKILAKRLSRIGLVTENDGDVLAVLCQIRSRLEWIYRTTRSIKLQIKKDFNPELTKQLAFLMREERNFSQIFRRYASEFGLTPRGRVGLVIGTRDRDEDEDLLS